MPKAAVFGAKLFPAVSVPATLNTTSPWLPVPMAAVAGEIEKSQVVDAVPVVQVGAAMSSWVAPANRCSELCSTPLPPSCRTAWATMEPVCDCANHLRLSVAVTPPFMVTPDTVGALSSIKSCPVPTAFVCVAWPALSTASMVNATGASDPAACTVLGTLKVYLRDCPVSVVVPATSAFPATCSAADAVVAFRPESICAVTGTVIVPLRFDHVVGASTLLTIGPCCVHFALRQTSPMPHFGSQGSTQRWRPVSQVAGAVHCASESQGPDGVTEQAASTQEARQAADNRLIERFSRKLECKDGGEAGREQHASHHVEHVGGLRRAVGGVHRGQVALEPALLRVELRVGVVHLVLRVQSFVDADAERDHARRGHRVAHRLLPAALPHVDARSRLGAVRLGRERERQAALVGLARVDQ